MTIIPEETLYRFLRTCLDLSRRALQEFESSSTTSTASAELHADFSKLIRDLHAEKRHDTTLADESWEWIWEVKPDLNPVQIYGRLAWINYTLLDLL